MTRRITAAAALSCALALGACQTTASPPAASGTPIVIPTAQLPAVVAKAQSRVVAACGFLPTAQTVAAIIKTFSSDQIDAVINSGETIAAGICAAANGGTYVALRKSKDSPRGSYRGVRIRGSFVR